jgi:replicative DNA helicase
MINNMYRDPRMINDLIFENLKETESGGLKSVPAGFVELDRLTDGWQKSELIVIAGRPAMGKTSFALSCALNAAVRFNKPTVIFALETSATHVVNRLISGGTEIELEKLRKGTLENWEWALIHSKIGALNQAPLIVDDTPALDILNFAEKCRNLKEKHDIQLIIVDYIQLMQGKGGDGKGIGDRWQEIGSISRALKSIAKELNVPVIALSQLSRAVENRPSSSKRPMLSDLAESGSIEQDADMVLLLYRPEYYGLDVDEDNNLTTGICEIIVAKNRNGETGRVRLKFEGRYVKFSDLDNDVAGFSTPVNPFASIKSSQDFDMSSNFVIRPSRLDDMEDDQPF